MTHQSMIGVTTFGIVALMLIRLPPLVARQDSVLNTFRALVEVNALASQRHTSAVEDELLVHGAITGMLRQLDPYSDYLPPTEWSAFQRRSSGAYLGIGVEVGMQNGEIMIIAPVEEGPAIRAGILAGDAILAIDGESTQNLSIADVDKRLAGEPGEEIQLEIRHANETESRLVTIRREPIKLNTVRGHARRDDGTWDYMLDPVEKIAYIRINSFRETTSREFRNALREAHAHLCNGIILDLRFNPGGLMNQAVAMADKFVKEGTILQTVTRRGVEREYRATPMGALTNPRLAILINEGSASSAEIVAGALQDLGRATIVGTRSFGKGSLQHLIELESIPAAIRLTVGVYRLPSGRVIHRAPHALPEESWGIQPDVLVPLDQATYAKVQQARLTFKTIHDPQLRAAWDYLVSHPPEFAAQRATGLRRGNARNSK
ncbi:MAG: S41 family peptidase [Phycisphaerae bacterium]